MSKTTKPQLKLCRKQEKSAEKCANSFSATSAFAYQFAILKSKHTTTITGEHQSHKRKSWTRQRTRKAAICCSCTINCCRSTPRDRLLSTSNHTYRPPLLALGNASKGNMIFLTEYFFPVARVYFIRAPSHTWGILVCVSVCAAEIAQISLCFDF